MAVRHIDAWKRLGADLTVYSRSPERGAAFAAEHGIAAAPDPEALLADADVLDVCTPTDTHADWIRRSAAAGRHVICEKPLARTYEEGRAALDACQAAGVRLFAAHVLRFFPAYVAAHEHVRSGRIGRVRRMRLTRTGEYPAWGDWFADPARSGGVIVDLGIHDLDYARWVAGEVVRVEASTGSGPDRGLPLTGTVHLHHENGAETEVVARWEVPGTEFHTTMEVEGDEGSLHLDSLPTPVLTDGSGRRLFEDDFSVEPYTAQLAEFSEALTKGTPPRVTAEDGLAALAIALDAERSASGQRSAQGR